MWPLAILAVLLLSGKSTPQQPAPQQSPPQPAPGQNTGQVVADAVNSITSLVESFKRLMASKS